MDASVLRPYLPYLLGCILGLMLATAITTRGSEQRRSMYWTVAITTVFGIGLELLGVGR